MSTEIELKLRLAPKDAPQMTRHPILAGLPTKKQHLLNTYYDTPELTLHARRVAVRFRKKGPHWLLTVKSAEPAQGGLAVRSEWEIPATPGHFDFSHIDHSGLQAELQQAQAQLQPIFHTNFRRQTWQVPFGHSTIELALDRGHIESCGRRRPLCEIELELLSGGIDDLFGLARQLQAAIPLHPAVVSKAEQGYRLFLQTPEHPFSPAPFHPAGHPSAPALFRAIALQALEHLQRNEQGVLAGRNPEFVRQAARATRTLCHAIRCFAPLLPGRFAEHHATAWQALRERLSDHLDVLDAAAELSADLLAGAPAQRRIARQLKQHARAEARNSLRTLQAEIASSGYARQLLDFTAELYALA